MSRKLLSSLIASLFATAPAFAQTSDDPFRVQGSVTAGWLDSNIKARDKAQLEVYQDLRDGVLSNIEARGRNSTSWFDGYGENFGRDDQYMFLRGGIYDVFKAGAYLNDIPHTFSTNAFSPYLGVGGNVLTSQFPQGALPNPEPPSTWPNYTLGYQRRDWGGFAEWQKSSPWYFRVDGNQVTFSGTKVGSGANGTSPGNGFTDLAFPTDYKTDNVGVEAGYQSSKATFSLRWDYSKFDNSNDTLRWTNPFFGGNQLDASYLPPDNEFNKFTLTGNYRDLPWHSVISARYTWAKTTSDVGLAQTALNSGGVFAPTLPNTDSFHGEKVNQSFALAWTAIPARNVDTRVYYYWTKLENNSTHVEYGDAPVNPSPIGCGNFTPPGGLPTQITGNCENELFSYTKNDVGFDIWWKFLPDQRLGGGFEYYDIDQTRVDYDKAHWSRVWVEYKNTMLETLTGRVKYQYIDKSATRNFTTDGLSPNDPNYLLAFTTAFDMQDSKTNQVKLYLDWTPVTNVGLSFEGTWSKIDYDETTYGRTSNERQGYFLSGNWRATSALALNAFGSWEQTKYPSNHRYIGTVAGGPSPPSGFCTTANPNCYDPFAPPFQQSPGSTTASYNWSSGTKDETWMIGVGADWQALETLKVSTSYLYVSNKGDASFSVQNGIVLNNPPVLPISNFDNSRQQWFNIKATWAYNRNWSFTGGYSFAKYTHDDIATQGFNYVVPYPGVATNTSLSYLNGYDAFTNGHNNIFYLLATYRFDVPGRK